MNAIEQFRLLAQPPAWALKEIRGGRLNGMTDIKPAWRIQAMTEAYGLCGIGWKYEVVKQWTEPGSDGQVFAFVDVLLYVKVDGEWSAPIPGTGGNLLIAAEKHGPHSNDEAYKMAMTDALSVCMKALGVAADIYMGKADDSKYMRERWAEQAESGSAEQAPASRTQEKPESEGARSDGAAQRRNGIAYAKKLTAKLSEEQQRVVLMTVWQANTWEALEELPLPDLLDPMRKASDGGSKLSAVVKETLAQTGGEDGK